MIRKQSSKQQGIALIVVLLALMVLGSVAGGLIMVSSNHLMHAQSGHESQEALMAARAGAMLKVGELRKGNLDPLPKNVLPTSEASFSAIVVEGDGTEPFPPAGTFYVESTGVSSSGKVRKVGILVAISESRWSHAVFGNQEVLMKSGSYTASFNSDGLGVTHAEASIATNNAKDGIKIEDYEGVVVGWSGSVDPVTKKTKKKKDKDGEDPKLVAEANVQGPPGSTESVVVKGKDADRSYNSFVTGTETANNDPVLMPLVPTDVAVGTVGTVALGATLPSISTSAVTAIPPGAYDYLNVGAGGEAVLDVSAVEPGTEVKYVFSGINLAGGKLSVKQPPGGDVVVKVFVDTGDGKDTSKGVHMSGASLINPSQKPINLQFLIAGEGANTLEGHDDDKDGLGPPTAYYVAYAPEGEIIINSGQVFGAVVGNRVLLDGDGALVSEKRTISPAVVHFDTALLDDSSNPPMVKVLSVRYY